MQSLATKRNIDGAVLPASAPLAAIHPTKSPRLSTLSVSTSLVGAILCAALLGCCQPNQPNCKDERVGPSGAEVFGIALGVGAAATTAIVIGVHHAHHTLKGCVADASGGLQLHSKGGKGTYLLSRKHRRHQSGRSRQRAWKLKRKMEGAPQRSPTSGSSTSTRITELARLLPDS